MVVHFIGDYQAKAQVVRCYSAGAGGTKGRYRYPPDIHRYPTTTKRHKKPLCYLIFCHNKPLCYVKVLQLFFGTICLAM